LLPAIVGSNDYISVRDWRRRPPLRLRVKLDINWCWIKFTRCPHMARSRLHPMRTKDRAPVHAMFRVGTAIAWLKTLKFLYRSIFLLILTLTVDSGDNPDIVSAVFNSSVWGA
jgi:hypothetical protein